MQLTGFDIPTSICFPGETAVRRGRVIAVVLVLVLGMGCARGGDPAAEDPCGEPEVLSSTMVRWQAFTAPLDELPPREKRSRIESFVSTVSMDDLRAVCCQGADGSDAETARFLRRLTRTKFEYDPPPVGDLIEFVRDTTLASICRDMAVRTTQDRRDHLTPAEGNALSDALLFRADLAADQEEAQSLEVWAAQFGSTDQLVSRMRVYLDTEEREIHRHGIFMAVESRDPRSVDLLIDALNRVADEPLDYHADDWPDIVEVAARVGQSRTLPFLERIVFEPGYDHWLRTRALRSIGSVQDPESMRLLLRVYRDGGGLRDSTWALPAGELRQHYQSLHFATRSLERLLIDRLRAGPPDQALDAYALIVRAVRFGPMVESSRVNSALEDFAGRDLGVASEEIRDTVARVESPPRPRAARRSHQER